MTNLYEIDSRYYPEKFLDEISGWIRQGEIIIMPSDTIYGFLALPQQEQQVRQIKKRDDKPFLYLISRIEQLTELGIDFQPYFAVLGRYWPGAITFILPTAGVVSTVGKPLTVTLPQTLGVRLPAWPVLQNLIDKAGTPLISTSVNIAGSPALNTVDEIVQCFGSHADRIIIDRDFSPQPASTIVDLSCRPYRIIRSGSVSFNEI